MKLMPVILEQIRDMVAGGSITRRGPGVLFYSTLCQPDIEHLHAFLEFLSEKTGKEYNVRTEHRDYSNEPVPVGDFHYSDRVCQHGERTGDYVMFRDESLFGTCYVTIMKTNGDSSILDGYEELLRRVVDVGEI